jgi:hypothetical protein
MGDLSTFLDRRDAAAWHVAADGDAVRIDVESPEDLAGLTWVLPAAAYREPIVRRGDAQVRRDRGDWLITAKPGHALSFESSMQRSAP